MSEIYTGAELFKMYRNTRVIEKNGSIIQNTYKYKILKINNTDVVVEEYNELKEDKKTTNRIYISC